MKQLVRPQSETTPEVTNEALEAIIEALAGRKGNGLIRSKREARDLMRGDVERSLKHFWIAHARKHDAIVPVGWLRNRKGREAIANEALELAGMIANIEAKLSAHVSGCMISLSEPTRDRIDRLDALEPGRLQPLALFANANG
jgi:hypothetical protein